MSDDLLLGLALARGPLREESMRADPGWWQQAMADGAVAIEVRRDRVSAEGNALRWRPITEADRPRAVLLGIDEQPRIAVLDSPGAVVSLREIGAQLSDAEAAHAVAAVALAQWHAGHEFCPRCGAPTRMAAAGWSRVCIADDTTHFPRTDPAVIVLVRDEDDRALLGRRVDWPEGWFSTLAGFVEAGESAEQTLRREVWEEANVRVDPARIRYRGSQPWPFPASLMLGYHAWAASGTPQADGEEIAEVRWVSRAEMATGSIRVPPRVSIARHLIEDWYGSPVASSWER